MNIPKSHPRYLSLQIVLKNDLTINSELNFKQNYRESIDILSYDTLFSNPTDLKLESKKEDNPGNYYLGGSKIWTKP